jgi:hypothetical protein
MVPGVRNFTATGARGERIVSEETGEMEGKMRQKERKKTMGLKNPDDRR